MVVFRDVLKYFIYEQEIKLVEFSGTIPSQHTVQYQYIIVFSMEIRTLIEVKLIEPIYRSIKATYGELELFKINEITLVHSIFY